MTTLYLLRHGQSEANLLHEFSNTGWKHPLTPLGVQQAQALAVRLAGAGIERIFTSPLMRAVQTAEILAARLDVPLVREPALIEFSTGALEGRSDEAGWAEYRAGVSEWMERGNPAARVGGGESQTEMVARLAALFRRLSAEYPAGRLALVGHGGLFMYSLPALVPNLPWAFVRERPIPNTGVIKLESKGTGWVCRDWCGGKLAVSG
jgi:broad specificity phosphatase PhoE